MASSLDEGDAPGLERTAVATVTGAGAQARAQGISRAGHIDGVFNTFFHLKIGVRIAAVDLEPAEKYILLIAKAHADPLTRDAAPQVIDDINLDNRSIGGITE